MLTMEDKALVLEHMEIMGMKMNKMRMDMVKLKEDAKDREEVMDKVMKDAEKSKVGKEKNIKRLIITKPKCLR